MQETIAGQLHNMKPDDWTPGIDVGFEPGEDESSLRVLILKPVREGCTHRRAVVTYDRGPDLYDVIVTDFDNKVAVETETYDRVYFDQLGELVFGAHAKPCTIPAVAITTWDHEGNPQTETF